MIWLQRLLSELGQDVGKPVLYGDNKACLAIANNPVHHKYTKHIDIRLHFVRELIQRDKLEVEYFQCPETPGPDTCQGVAIRARPEEKKREVMPGRGH